MLFSESLNLHGKGVIAAAAHPDLSLGVPEVIRNSARRASVVHDHSELADTKKEINLLAETFLVRGVQDSREQVHEVIGDIDVDEEVSELSLGLVAATAALVLEVLLSFEAVQGVAASADVNNVCVPVCEHVIDKGIVFARVNWRGRHLFLS